MLNELEVAMRLFLFSLFLPLFLSAETIVFNKEVDGEKSEVQWQVSNQSGKLRIVGNSDTDITTIICSPNYQFEQFICAIKEKGETLTFEKKGNTLEALSQKGEKTKKETYEAGDLPWVQDFGFGLKPFLSSEKDKLTFYIINPKDLSLKTMVATKQTIDTKTFNGKEYTAQKVKITLDGFYKKFWKAELWFDFKTKQLLMYKANEGPATPTTILTFKG